MNLVAVIPPLLLAGFVRDLGFIITFAGLSGFLILATPELLFLAVIKRARNARLDIAKYNKWQNKLGVILAVLAFSLIGFVLTLYSLIREVIG